MAESLAAIVLAAGAGQRLRPLTQLRPKALCPVAGRPLLDHAVDRVRPAVGADGAIAVNLHHGADQMLAHLTSFLPEVHRSWEVDEALGTAGAVGRLRSWLDGRPVLTVNADAWCRPDLVAFARGWDGESVRILIDGHEPFGARSRIVAALHPWSVASTLEPVPSGLWERCWRGALADGAIDAVAYDGPFVDCGTPADYLRANLAATGGASVVGEGAVVHCEVHESVLWPGTLVREGEALVRAIRASDEVTVLVR
jgi:MurNAc alpha-1-phosphate uridylyltransferase